MSNKFDAAIHLGLWVAFIVGFGACAIFASKKLAEKDK